MHRAVSLPCILTTFTFNSLFEMLHPPEPPDQVFRRRATFNSLFEMLTLEEGRCVKPVAETFNSLFEMLESWYQPR